MRFYKNKKMKGSIGKTSSNKRGINEMKKIRRGRKNKKIEIKASEAKQKIVKEPTEDDPNVTTICFRYPYGGKKNLDS